MENKFLKFLKLDGLLDSVKGYIENRIQLFKQEMQEKAANVITTAIFLVFIAFCGLMAIVFLSLALGNYLNGVFDSTYLGFCVMGAFYILVVLIMAANVYKGNLHNKVRSAIYKALIKKMGKQEPQGSKIDIHRN